MSFKYLLFIPVLIVICTVGAVSMPIRTDAQTTDNASQLAALASQVSTLTKLVESLTSAITAFLTGRTQSAAVTNSSTITIGESSVLSNPDSGNGNLLVTQSATLAQTATIQSLSFYVTQAAGSLRLAIYDATGPDGGPGQKVAETNSVTATTGWNTVPVTAPVSLPAGTYWLAYLPSSSSLAFVKNQDATSAGRYYTYTYGAMPQTFSTTPSTTASHWSFYATLDTASTGSTQTTPAPTVTFTANPTSITSGNSTTLTWSSTNASSCTASGGWSGGKNTSGSQSVSPTSNATYTLTCTGTGGSANKSVTVTVTQAQTQTQTQTGHPAPSWALSLQEGKWSAVSLNTVADVDPKKDPNINPNYPNAAPWNGIEGVSGVINDWTGGAFATGYGSYGALIVWGGGHQGYYGNEVYAFDLGTRMWKRLSDPYPNPQFTSLTPDYPLGLFPDGTPTAAHTYEFVDYHPGSNSFIDFRGSGDNLGGYDVSGAYMFSFDSLTWRHGPIDPKTHSSSGGWSAYDSSRDVFWVHPGFYTGNAALAKFDPNVANADGTYGAWTDYAFKIPASYAVAARDPVNDVILAAGTLGLVGIDLKNPNGDAITLTTGGSVQSLSGRSGWDWSPVRQAFIFWSGAGVYEVKQSGSNWKTAQWMWTNLTNSGNTVTPDYGVNGVYSRFRLVDYDEMELAVTVNSVTGSVYVFRIPKSSATTVQPPTVTLSVSPSSITSGDSATLSWSSTNASSCTASGGWSGGKNTSGSQSVSPTSNATYTLTCTGTGGSANKSVTVTVTQAQQQTQTSHPLAPSWVLSLEEGKWAAVSLNTMSAVDPQNNSSLNPNYPGSAPWHAVQGQVCVLNCWNGGAFASGYGQSGSLLIYGGGHDGYWGSEVYAFDMATRLWKLASNPYPGPFNWPYNDGAYPDGSAVSVHTYDYVTYLPLTNSFAVMYGSPDARSSEKVQRAQILDLNTATWRRSTENTGGQLLSGGASCYDRNRNVVWINGPAASSINYKFEKFDPNGSGNGTFTNYTSIFTGIGAAAACDPVDDLFVLTQFRNDNPDYGTVYARSLANPNNPAVVLTQVGDIPPYEGHNGFEWSDVRQAFVYYASGSGVYEFKHESGNTWRWTKLTSSANAVTPQVMSEQNGVFSRFQVATYENSVGDLVEVAVVVNRDDGPVYAFRIPSGSSSSSTQTTPAPTVTLSVSPSSITSGDSATLSWSSTNASSCTASGGWSGGKNTSGSQSVSPTSNATYTLTCTGTGGSANKSVTVTVTQAQTSNTTADADFAARCSAAGVVRCIGYDSTSDFGNVIAGSGGAVPTIDTSIKTSGAGSVKFTINGNTGANAAGVIYDTLGGNFAQHSHFYVQFRQRIDQTMLDLGTYLGDNYFWKQIIIHGYSSCGNAELTTVDAYYRGYPYMYSQCGGDGFFDDIGGGDYLIQQGDYQCHYQSSKNGPNSCGSYQPNEWITYYYDINIGTWGQPDSYIKAYMAYNGEGYKQFIDQPNHILYAENDSVHNPNGGYLNFTIGPYITRKDAGISHPTAYTWYDELIVSTQPIAAPGVAATSGSSSSTGGSSSSGSTASTKFSNGDRVQIATGDGSNLNIRATANGALLGQQTDNALGTVIGGPVAAGGYNWWNINFDSGIDGWAAEDFLIPTTQGSQTQSSGSTVTIGESTVLSNPDSGNGNLLVAQSAQLAQTATIESLSFYVTQAAGSLRLAIYDATGPGGGPGQKRAETNSVTAATGWNTVPVIVPASLPAGTYWLAYLPSSSNLAFLKNSDGTSNSRNYAFTYGVMPQTFSTTPGTSASHWSFYATLDTGSGGGSTQTTSAPTVTISASQTSITQGQSPTLTWSSTNATACTASGGWSGNKATAGTQSVTPISNTTYTLACTGAGGSAQQSVTIAVTSGGANNATEQADWIARSTGPGVVWAHDFSTDDEVNNFRWTSGYGNDPQAIGSSYAGYVRHITTDGFDDGALEIYRPSGTGDGSDWWRPFSPMLGGTTSGNGKGAGQDDPGANGTLPPQAYNPSFRGEINNWGLRGYYGSAGNWTYDGSEYYLQARVKMDPRRVQGINANVDGGKLFIIGRNDLSNVSQKIVVQSGHPISGKNYLGMYSLNYGNAPLGQHPPGVSVQGDQPNTSYGTVGDGLCRYDNNGGRLANCWSFPDPAAWVTLEWHVKPGTDNGNDTLIEVYAAMPGDTAFTRVWYQPNASLLYDPNHPQGHNAVHLSTYLNGLNASEIYHRYDQVILSKEFIPVPHDSGEPGVGGETGSTASAPTVTLSASPTSITQGQSSTLTWSSTNASSCTASGSWSGGKSTSGTQAVTPTSNATYTITCTGTGGSANKSVTVAVTTTTVDTTPPQITSGAPTGTLSSGTTQTQLSVTTNEAATCRYSANSSTVYSSMTAFSTTGGTSHSTTIAGLTNGTSYTYYVKCQDTAGNTTTNASISFSVAQAQTTTGSTGNTGSGNSGSSSGGSSSGSSSSSGGSGGSSASSGGSSGGGGGTSSGGTSSSGGGGFIPPSTNTQSSSGSTGTAGENAGSTSNTETTIIIPLLTHNLWRGTEGDDVKTLQDKLILDGFLAAGNATGYYGSLTEEAVKAFQRANNIVSSGDAVSTGYGVMGPSTRAIFNQLYGTSAAGGSAGGSHDLRTQLLAQLQALLKQVAELQALLAQRTGTPTATPPSTSSVPFTRNLWTSVSGDDVSLLQQKLAEDPTLYPEGDVTGYFGEQTKAAIERFQCAYGIVCEGDPLSTGYGAVGPSTRAKLNEVYQ